MGWNSWDAFGTSLKENQAKAQADVMADKLLPHGWKFFTVDIQWYEPASMGCRGSSLGWSPPVETQAYNWKPVPI